MDQKANAVADLAQVLEIQNRQSSFMKENLDKLAQRRTEFLAKKWGEIEELAKKADEGEVARLGPEIKRLEESLQRKKSEKEIERITKAIRLQTHRFKKLQWAQRMIAAREEAETTAASSEVAAMGESGEAPAVAGPKINLNNPVVISLLPRHLKENLPAPFSLEGVTVEWADLYDAEYAKDWPEAVTHDLMGTVRRRPPVPNADRIKFPVFETVAIAEAAAAAEAHAIAEKKRLREEWLKNMSWPDWLAYKSPFRVKSLHAPDPY